MFDEYESIPQDLVEIREVIVDLLKEINIESKPLREFLADFFLGEPLTSDLPECPDVSMAFMVALLLFRASKKDDLKHFIEILKATVRILQKEDAQQFEDFIDALFRKYSVKLMID